MKKTSYIQRTFLALMLALVLLGVASAITWARTQQAATPEPQKTHKQNTVNQNNETWTWNHIDNGIGIEVKVRGKVQLNDDYTDIVGLSNDGWLRIKDDRGGRTRKLEVTPNADGSLTRSYWVEGQARPYNDEAERWLATVLTEAVRQGGLDAANRAQKILAQRGAGAVLDEISLLGSDYVKGIYFRELFKATNLDSASLRRALREVERQMSSDYEKAQVLLKIAESYLDDDATRSAYLEAVATISSDYERGRVLSALLKKGDLNNETVAHTLKTAGGISSDYEKAQVLVKMAEGKGIDSTVRHAYIETASTIKSDYERARALLGLLRRTDLDRDALLQVVKSATGISSDHEKAKVLVRVAAMQSGDEKVRAALIEAARTIDSSPERERVLSATYR